MLSILLFCSLSCVVAWYSVTSLNRAKEKVQFREVPGLMEVLYVQQI